VFYHRAVFFDARHSSATLRRGHWRNGEHRARGYIVTLIGESERILPHAVQQRFERSSSGALVAPTEGSTKPVSVVVTNAGIATVEQYDLRMP
jgi:hypothetical protein